MMETDLYDVYQRIYYKLFTNNENNFVQIQIWSREYQTSPKLKLRENELTEQKSQRCQDSKLLLQLKRRKRRSSHCMKRKKENRKGVGRRKGRKKKRRKEEVTERGEDKNRISQFQLIFDKQQTQWT